MEKIISVVTKVNSHLDNVAKITESNFDKFPKVSQTKKTVEVKFKPKSKIHLRKKVEARLSSSSNRARPVTAMSLGFADSLNKLPRH